MSKISRPTSGAPEVGHIAERVKEHRKTDTPSTICETTYTVVRKVLLYLLKSGLSLSIERG